LISALYSAIVSNSETSLAKSSSAAGSSFTLISFTVVLNNAGLPANSAAWYCSGKVTLTSTSTPTSAPINASSKPSINE